MCHCRSAYNPAGPFVERRWSQPCEGDNLTCDGVVAATVDAFWLWPDGVTPTLLWCCTSRQYRPFFPVALGNGIWFQQTLFVLPLTKSKSNVTLIGV
ncbi:hypothetical protein OH492_24935 [Vibrio chagasii]|nr:hypothetical protein [Vibrio chagasii]